MPDYKALEDAYVMQHGDMLEDIVDMHLHVAPSLMQRRTDIAAVTLRCEQFGYKAVVHKDHHMMTGPACTIVNEYVNKGGKCRAIGAVCLNNTNGGLNPYAVLSAIGADCHVVWLPTVSAQNHMDEVARGTSFPKLKNGVVINEKAIRLVDSEGKVRPEIYDILDIIKAHPDVLLAMGHGNCYEINSVVEAACDIGLQKQIMVDHPDFMLNAPEDLVKHWVELGVWIEWLGTMYCPISAHHHYDYADMVRKIKLTGIGQTIVDTDFGQSNNLDPVKGYDHIIGGLLDNGLTKSEIRVITSENPSSVLGLS